MQIIYKKQLRHAYAKIQGEQVILLIPFSHREDKYLHAEMERLAERLEKKIGKKQKNQIFTDQGILLFGERISYEDLPPYADPKDWQTFFTKELYEYAGPLLARYAAKLGYTNIPLRIRTVKTRRGSCTHDNRIMLNTQLVHLPTRLITYVIVHEVCHLVHKNHASIFWELVGELLPAYPSYRQELKNQLLY